MNQDDLILCAFRYCLGRRSYVVPDMALYLEKHWLDICPEYRKIIRKEIVSAIEKGCAGMDQDEETWVIMLKNVLIKEDEACKKRNITM